MRPARERLTAWAAGDEAAHAELADRYRPVLHAFARRVGLADEAVPEACEAALSGLLGAHRAAPFEPGASTREPLFEQARAHLAGASLSASDLLQSDAALREAWDAEWRRALLRAAMSALSHTPGTDARMLQAYDLHVVEKRPVAEVAHELGMSRTAVHSAKSLLLGALAQAMARLEGDF